MTVLEQFYYGKILPCEQGFVRTGEYNRLNRDRSRLLHAWAEGFTPEDREAFEKIADLDNAMEGISMSQAYLNGFRLGAVMMLELLQDGDRGEKAPT